MDLCDIADIRQLFHISKSQSNLAIPLLSIYPPKLKSEY